MAKREITDRSNYLNTSITHLVNKSIYEYDLSKAGFSVLKEKEILSKEDINYLERADKLSRNIVLGKMERDIPGIAGVKQQGFKEAIKMLVEKNEIQIKDILSIKSDAIFLLKPIKYTKFGKHYKFVLKNSYTSYYYLNKKEFYYNVVNNILHVKGINNMELENHQEFFLGDLRYIFDNAESCTKQELFPILKDYRNLYLNRELPKECYRELSLMGSYRSKQILCGETLYMDNIENIDDIDIVFNYTAYIIPLIQLLL